MSEQRRREITAAVSAHGRVGLADLARQFAVSEMTIRRDLDDLTDRGALRRVRGGAVAMDAPPDEAMPSPPSPPSPPSRPRRPVDELFGPAPDTAAPRPQAPPPTPPPAVPPPAAPPRATVDLAERLAHSPSLILDAGPDAVALARAIRDIGPRAGQQVITRDPAVADALSTEPAASGPRVLLTGGEARPGEPGLLGPWAAAPLADVHVTHAVLTASGLDPAGWWRPSPESAAWAREAATHTDTLTLWVSAAALGARGTARVGGLSGVHRVVVAGPVTGQALAGDTLAALVHAGIEVVLGR